MSDKSISQFSEVTSVEVNDLLILERDGVFKSVQVQNLSNGLIKVVLNLTSSDILSLQTTPVTILAAQGAGTYIRPIFGGGILNYGAATYTANSLRLRYIGGADADYIFTFRATFLTAAASTTDVASASGVTKVTMEENTGVEIFVNTADPTAGDGTVTVEIFFQIFKFA